MTVTPLSVFVVRTPIRIVPLPPPLLIVPPAMTPFRAYVPAWRDIVPLTV